MSGGRDAAHSEDQEANLGILLREDSGGQT